MILLVVITVILIFAIVFTSYFISNLLVKILKIEDIEKKIVASIILTITIAVIFVLQLKN